MAAYIAIFLSLICIVLLAIILIKFKRLFSTEAIIDKTRIQMNKIVTDINNNANMCIELINNATKRTRTLMSETDQQMNDFKEAAQILRDLISKVERINQTNLTNNLIYMDSLGMGKSEQQKSETNTEKKSGIKPISNKGGYKLNAYKCQQQSLFDQDMQDNVSIKIQKQENKVEEGEIDLIPKIVTNIIPEDPLSSANLLDEKVRKLYNSGFDVDEIAAKLSCSTSEVQFIIEMLN